MAVLLNNRSTVSFEVGMLADACLDAHKSLQYNPQYAKALLRRGKCLKALGFGNAGQKDITAAERFMDPSTKPEETDLLALANTAEEMELIFGKDMAKDNSSLPHRAQFYKRTTTPEDGEEGEKSDNGLQVDRSAKGRGYSARERIPAGVTVLQETPFAFAPRLENLLNCCSFCLQFTSSLYAGDSYRKKGKKSRGFFCSESCAEQAWQHFGEEESKNVFYLLCPNDGLLALRLIRGLRESPNTTDTRPTEPSLTTSAPPFFELDLHTHLRTLEGSFTRELVREKVSSGADTDNSLEGNMNTNKIPLCSVGGRESVVAALALHMGAVKNEGEAELLRKAMRQVLLNAKEVKCLARQKSQGGIDGALQLHANTILSLAKAVYPYAAVLNHSCDPNCCLTYVENPQCCCAELVVRTLRPVMEGEELTISYYTNPYTVGDEGATGGMTVARAATQRNTALDRFNYHSLRQRLMSIKTNYGFFCQCHTCTSQVDEPVETVEKTYYIQSSDLYQKGQRMIREGKYETAVQVLLQSYELVMRHICPAPRPPQLMLPKTHLAIALAYFHLQKKQECFEHLKAAVELDIQIHKTDCRSHYINDYTRLAFIAPKEEDKKLYAEKAVELLKIFYAPSSTLDMQISYTRSSYLGSGGEETKK
ncbi:SET and MYND domain-containing protein [Angomonas deanei]|nr:SET and MYND domain-containing protein [Angomonas deanei]|eukprot:EPY24561.1 SET and MYND domain-containing protein [Angomonas deanei]